MVFLPHGQRIVFMGSPDFSVPTLKRLVQLGYNVVGVYSQPPKPVGRGYTIQLTPVNIWAKKHSLPVFTPKSFRKDLKAVQQLKNLKPDVIITVAYGLILPLSILSIPLYHCLNLHASLLPRWRGAAPLQHALFHGDKKTGGTLMQMEEGLDTGPIFFKKILKINEKMTLSKLHDTLSIMSADVIEKALPLYLQGSLIGVDQPTKGVKHAPKIKKEDGKIDWNKPANVSIAQLRALTPWPGVYFQHKGTTIKVLEAQAISSPIPEATSGQLLKEDHIVIQCAKETALACKIVQKPGKKAMKDIDFLRGYALKKGEKLT